MSMNTSGRCLGERIDTVIIFNECAVRPSRPIITQKLSTPVYSFSQKLLFENITQNGFFAYRFVFVFYFTQNLIVFIFSIFRDLLRLFD